MQVLENLSDLENLDHYVLYFTADWCVDCRFIKPALPEIESEFKDDFTFVEVDRDKWIDFAADKGIMGIPSLIVMKDGQEVDRLVNRKRKTKEEIEKFLNEAKEK